MTATRSNWQAKEGTLDLLMRLAFTAALLSVWVALVADIAPMPIGADEVARVVAAMVSPAGAP